MHPAINYINISFIVDVAMGQIPRFTERISGIQNEILYKTYISDFLYLEN